MTLPFSYIEDKFNCDRYGETNDKITNEIDYYGQAGPEFTVEIFLNKFNSK